MAAAIFRSITCFTLLCGSSALLAREPFSPHFTNPVTLSPLIEPIGQEQLTPIRSSSAVVAKPTTEDSHKEARNQFPGARYLKSSPENADEPASPRKGLGIFRVSFPELFPTPAEKAPQGAETKIPPPPGFEIMDDLSAKPAPLPPPFPEAAASPYPEMTPVYSEGSCAVEEVEPRTCRKWRMIRCPTGHSLFKIPF